MDRVAVGRQPRKGIDGPLHFFFSGRVVLHPYVDEDFHEELKRATPLIPGSRSAKSDRLVEGYVVDRGGYDRRGRNVDARRWRRRCPSNAAGGSHEVAQRIGVVKQYEFGQDREMIRPF